MGKLNSGKKEGFKYALSGGCWHGETVGELTVLQSLCGWLGVHSWLFLVGPKLKLDKN